MANAQTVEPGASGGLIPSGRMASQAAAAAATRTDQHQSSVDLGVFAYNRRPDFGDAPCGVLRATCWSGFVGPSRCVRTRRLRRTHRCV
jgi:hypothetical protein